MNKKLLIFIVLLAVCIQSSNWAVLVAGSHTWSNYRHQADVYHAYQVLIKGGFDPNKIITFAYDDIAHHLTNPFKGKVFNKPTYKQAGVDVYEGVKIDYSKAHVTPQIFQAVLEGNKSFVAGKGTGRVLQSTSSDNVFIFFSDHGAPGLIAFPNKYLYADHMLASFAKMNGRYNKMVFYLQACESGSMFQKLPTNTKIYALSAANPTQSSWGCYCSPDDVVGGKHIGSCLGDLFSVNFVQDTEKGNYKQTLDDQFKTIATLTTKSQVMQWGDLSFKGDVIQQYLTSKSENKNLRFIKPLRKIGEINEKQSIMDSRTMKLQSLSALYARQRSAQILKQMQAQMKQMIQYDNSFKIFSQKLKVNGSYDASNINFECLRTVIDYYESQCKKISDYGLSKVKYISHACQSHKVEDILGALSC